MVRQNPLKEDLEFDKMKNFELEHIIPYNNVMPDKSDAKNWKDVTFDYANQV